MADIKISEMTSASIVNETDNVEISQEVSAGVFASFKASILAIANKIVSGINFTSALETTNKTITGAINEVAQGGGGSGGHTILDDDGTALTQEDNLQFVGVYSEDDSTNETTKVNIVREMTQAQYALLSADEKKGIIRITDDDYVCEASEVAYDKANDVSVETELDSKVDWVSNNFIGAKNLIPYPYASGASKTTQGITYTNSAEGWIYLNSTTTAEDTANYDVVHPTNFPLILDGNRAYTISLERDNNDIYGIMYFSDSSGSGISTTYSAVYEDGSSKTTTSTYVSLNSGGILHSKVTFKTASDNPFYVKLTMRVGTGKGPFNNNKGRWTLKIAPDNDDTWKPWAMTNKQLTDVVKNVPTTAGTYALQAVRNADGSITYSWT